MAKKRVQLKEATVLVPLTYNDGSPVPERIITGILQEIFDTFDGWTVSPEVQGAYRMRSGRRQVDKLLPVSVIVEVNGLTLLERMVARWGALLDQELMLLKLADSTIRFIPPAGEEGEL
jgi:hypothetical protein